MHSPNLHGATALGRLRGFLHAHLTWMIEHDYPNVAHYVPDGIAGVLLPPADPSDTAATVASFLAHDEQRDAMGRAGRESVREHFLEPRHLEQWVALLEELA